MEKPVIVNKKLEEFEPPENLLFERILGRNVLTRIKDREYYLKKIHRLLHINGTIVFAEIIPSASKRISSFLDPEVIIPEDMKLLKKRKKKFTIPRKIWLQAGMKIIFISLSSIPDLKKYA